MPLSNSVLLEFWLRPPPVERMPLVAANLLAEGYESTSLVECAAMYASDHSVDVCAAFEAALRELGSAWTSRADAVIHEVRVQSLRLVEGNADPADVVRAVRPLYVLDDFLDQHPEQRWPELRFWYECWTSETEPIGLNHKELRLLATDVIRRSKD